MFFGYEYVYVVGGRQIYSDTISVSNILWTFASLSLANGLPCLTNCCGFGE